MKQILHLISNLPMPIALMIHEYIQDRDSHHFIALHRITDTAELITRFFAIIALSDLHQKYGGFPESIKRELVVKLARPSFGAWRDIAEKALHNLQECFMAELPQFWENHWKPLIGGNEGSPEKEILPLRNHLAHAGRLTDTTAETLLHQHQSRFENTIQQLDFLSEYSLVATLDHNTPPILLKGLPDNDWLLPRASLDNLYAAMKPHSVYLKHSNTFLNLFPLHCYDVVMVWREEEGSFCTVDKPSPLIYRRYDKQRLEFTALAPQTSFAHLGENFLQAFLSVFKLLEWKQEQEESENRSHELQQWYYDFSDMIESLKEGLVGRKEQLRLAKRWIREHQQTGGVLWISGKPGVGKSAFMAALTNLKGDSKFNACIIPFFFRTGDARCSSDLFFRAAILQISEKFGLSIRLHPEQPLQEQFTHTIKQMRQKQQQESNPTTLLFLLDGLDEISGQYPGFHKIPLTYRHPHIIWVCAGRSIPPLSQIFSSEGVESLWEHGELPSLNESNIREIFEKGCERRQLYQLRNRDELLDDGTYRNPFTEAVKRHSEGLPLYVQLVIQDLKEKRLSFHDEHKLPPSLEEYFEKILKRLNVSDISQILTDALALLVWTVEPVTQDMLQEILQIHYTYWKNLEEVVASALRYGHVMLRHSATPEGGWGWMIDHDSFRQYLHKTPTIRNARMQARHLLLTWCSQWQTHRHPYALRHYAEHLAECGQWDTLHQLIATSDDYQPWVKARYELEGSYAGYLNDLALAWNHIDQRELTGEVIGIQIRYALIKSSIHSIADNIPAPLMITLIQRKILDPEVGLEYVRQIPDLNQKSHVFEKLLPYLSDELLHIALMIVQEFKEPDDNEWGFGYQGEMFAKLAPRFDEHLLPLAQKIALDIKNLHQRDDALEALSYRMAELQQIDNAMLVIKEIGRGFVRSKALRSILPLLPEKCLEKVLAMTNNFEKDNERDWVLQDFAKRLGEFNRFDEAFQIVCNDIPDEESKLEVLNKLSLHCTTPQIDQILDLITSFEKIERLQDKCIELIYALAPKFSELQRAKALEIIKKTDYEANVAWALVKLVENTSLHDILVAVQKVKYKHVQQEIIDFLITQLIERDDIRGAKEIIDNIPNDMIPVSALTRLASKISSDEMEEIFDKARVIEDEWDRVRCLTGISHYCTKSLFLKALDEVKRIEDSDCRIHLFQGIIGYIPEELLENAIDIILTMKGFHEQEEFFLCLESHFQKHANIIEQFLLKNKDTWRLRITYVKCAPYVSQRFLEIMLSEVSVLNDSDWSKKIFLKNAIPHLNHSLLQKTLSIIRNIDQRYSHISLDMLIDLIPHLPDTCVNDALQIALEIWEDENEEEAGILTDLFAEFLVEIFPHLQQEKQSEIFQKILLLNRKLEFEERRIMILSKIFPHLHAPLNWQIANEALELSCQKDAYVPTEIYLDFVKTLVETLPQFPKQNHEQVITIALNVVKSVNIQDPHEYEFGYDLTPYVDPWRIELFEKLIPYISERFLEKAIDAVLAIPRGQHQTRALAALFPHLTRRLLKKAILAVQDRQGIQEFGWESWDPSMPISGTLVEDEGEYSQFWLKEDWNPYEREEMFWQAIAPQLTDDVLKEILRAVQIIGGIYEQTLENLDSYLATLSTENNVQSALLAASKNYSLDRLEYFMENISKALDENEQGGKLSQFVEETIRSGVSKIEPGEALEIWTEKIHDLSSNRVEGLIEKLCTLLPLLFILGGTTAIQTMREAISEVGHWWS